MIINIPIKIISEANRREHHMAKYRRVKRQQMITMAFCLQNLGYIRKWPGRYKITFTRIIGKRGKKFDEGDNLNVSFKAIRDALTRYMRIDDGSDRLEWSYGQERGDIAHVRVEITEI